jgi:cytochrome c oxidase assembly factor CtaG
MTTWQLLTSSWDWEPSVLIGCAALIVIYMAMVHSQISGDVLFFISGVIVLLLALVSPLDTLGDTYLFSAHMLQHILLVMIVPPLLLCGITSWLARKMLSWQPLAKTERPLRRPVLAWLLGIGTLFVWHAPLLYNATLKNEAIHIVEHLCFLVTSTIFWWPIFAPLEESRLVPLAAIGYLFAAATASTMLGIILTFASTGLYPAYLHPFDTLNILSLIRNQWGLSPEIDQQFGGLLMWILGSLIYICVIMFLLARWYGKPEADVTSPSSASNDCLRIAVDSVPKEVV